MHLVGLVSSRAWHDDLQLHSWWQRPGPHLGTRGRGLGRWLSLGRLPLSKFLPALVPPLLAVYKLTFSEMDMM